MTLPPESTTAPVLPALVAAVAVTALTHLYLWRRLFHDTRTRGAPALLLPALFLPVCMLGLLYMRTLPLAIARPVMAVCFTYLGILFFLVLLLVAIDAATIFGPASLGRARVQAAAAVCGATALSIVAMRNALQPVAVRPCFVRAPASLDGYRIAQLADLHIGAMRGRAFVADVVASVNAARPDLVVITGDLVDGTPEQLLRELAPLRALHAPTYLVLGNHEHLSGAAAWRSAFPALGIHVLTDERVHLASFDLVGLDDEATPAQDTVLASSGRYTIVLAHEPRDVTKAARHGADVQLSAHTHGGQIFPLHVLERWVQGYLVDDYLVGSTQLHVSPGTGFWGPPMRLGSRASIDLVTLTTHL